MPIHGPHDASSLNLAVRGGTIRGYPSRRDWRVIMQALRSRSHIVLVVLVLGLGLGGVALAQTSSRSSTATVTLMDGKLKISQTTFAPGVLTLIVSNQGKLSHGLAIMGSQLKPKETPTIGSGKSFKLTVKLGIGMYHIWDPVRSSMSHATMLMVKFGKTSGSASSSGGNTIAGGGSSSSGSGGNSPPTIAGGGGGSMTMDPNDPCAGM
jgi:hypothetical protein